ncbi:hypothetical protein ACFSC6_09495 [Rufibacter sediminis]|uniref:Uncharacterized protein n=1 Tax=Rufibacter sediminis TaxID=2762756 RepID=A0ABR6VXI5_9BACT|nr:hypothetical protein [Rufibacter sediminis]MBC3541877.1 hypothetical protein [Rufibacter sediminis]
MARPLLLGILLFLGITITCRAQVSDSAKTKLASHRYLLLSKAGSLKRYRLYAGDRITFKHAKFKGLRTETIVDIRGNSFFLQGMEVPLTEVEKVRLRNHTGGRKAANFGGRLLKTAGTVFIFVGGLNALLNLNNTPDRQDGLQTMAGALTLYGLGEGLHILRNGTYPINKKWTLKVIEMY